MKRGKVVPPFATPWVYVISGFVLQASILFSGKRLILHWGMCKLRDSLRFNNKNVKVCH